MLYKIYFSPSLNLAFSVFLKSIFERVKYFNFEESPTINYFCYDLFFWYHIFFIFPTKVTKIYSFFFVQKFYSFMLKFTSMMHFQLNFFTIWCEIRVNIVFNPYRHSIFFDNICQKDNLFSVKLP